MTVSAEPLDNRWMDGGRRATYPQPSTAPDEPLGTLGTTPGVIHCSAHAVNARQAWPDGTCPHTQADYYDDA
jgi:hypothetical protein